MTGDLLSLAQVAELRRLNYWQVAHAIRGGGLPSRTVGRTKFVTRADAEAWPGPAPRGGRRPATKPQDASEGAGVPEPVAGFITAGWTPDDPCGVGGVGSYTEPPELIYAPALVYMLDESTCMAEVIIGTSGVPDDVIDFGGFKAQRRGIGGAYRQAGGVFLYDEV